MLKVNVRIWTRIGWNLYRKQKQTFKFNHGDVDEDAAKRLDA
jgi:hypothetical protein